MIGAILKQQAGMTMKILGLDLGTTTLSAVCMDIPGGRVLRACTEPNRSGLRTGHGWEHLQDPEAIVKAAGSMLDALLETEQDVCAIGVTGQMHGIVYVDASGQSLSPLMTWQDQRGALAEEGTESVCTLVRERTGCRLFPGYGLASHMYNLRNGLVPLRTAKLATIADYVVMRLTGRSSPLMHISQAAGLGLFDLQTQTWKEEALGLVPGSGDALPSVIPHFEIAGMYRGIPVCTALGDNQAGFLGSVDNPQENILVNMGTGGQVSALSDRILETEGVETRPLNEHAYLVVSASLCGGRAYACLAELFASIAQAFGCGEQDPYSVMNRFLDLPQDPDPLCVETTFAGTRDDPGLRGRITNISTENLTATGLTRGVLEGMVRELYGGWMRMKTQLPLAQSRITVSGNAMRLNPQLRRITETCFGMPVTLTARTEEAACGAAVSAAVAVGLMDWHAAIGQ